jgi:hypothetical protein
VEELKLCSIFVIFLPASFSFFADMNVFGFAPLRERMLLVQCNYCSKVMKASAFSHHLGWFVVVVVVVVVVVRKFTL